MNNQQTTTPPIHVLFVKGEPVAVSTKPFDLPQYGDPSAISQQACAPKEALAVAFNRGWDANQSPTAQNEQATQAQTELCYSCEDDDYCVRDLQSLIDTHEMNIGDVYNELDLVQHAPSHYFSIDDLLENMASAADDDAGEHAEGFPDLSKEDEKELEQLISNWLDKKLSVNFFTAINSRERTITADDLGIEHDDETKQLWCVHIPGPDDIYAAPSKMLAQQYADLHNKCMSEYWEKQRAELSDTLPSFESIKAVAIEWPHETGHAEDMAANWPELERALVESRYAKLGCEIESEGGEND